MKEVWRGAALMSQIDELGHINARFWHVILRDGLARFAVSIGLDPPVAGAQTGSLRPLWLHTAFRKEIHAGDGLVLTMMPTAIGTDDAILVAQLTSLADPDLVHARFHLKVQHVTPAPRHPFAWNKQARALLGALQSEAADPPTLFEPLAPDFSRFEPHCLVRSVIDPGMCGPDQEVSLDWVMGQLYASQTPAFARWRRALGSLPKAGNDGDPSELVLVEALVHYALWPSAGALFDVYGAPLAVTDKGVRFHHFMVSTETGKVFAQVQSVMRPFNLRTRKAIPLTDDWRDIVMKDACPSWT